jgi:hypothetical protein
MLRFKFLGLRSFRVLRFLEIKVLWCLRIKVSRFPSFKFPRIEVLGFRDFLFSRFQYF